MVTDPGYKPRTLRVQPLDKIRVTESVGRAIRSQRLYGVLRAKALEQQNQGGDQPRAVPPGLATNEDSLASLPIAKRCANRVGEVMLVQIDFAVVKEAQADLFDIPVYRSGPGVEGDHSVKVCRGNGRSVLAITSDVVIGGSPHPETGEDLTPEWLTEVSVVGVAQSFELLGGEVGGLHGGVLSGGYFGV